MVELYQLRYFQTVAEVGTLRDAAERLAVSQSAVSRAIAMLESEIGVELFTRRGRANELNRFGQAFLRTSLAAQRSLDTAMSGVRQLAGVDAGTVALGFLASLGVATVPRLIRRHHDQFPAARFELHHRPGPALVSDMATGLIDVCISYPMTFDESPGVKWHSLFTQRLYAVVDQEHPLAGRELIGFEELAGQPFIVFDRSFTLRRIFDDACARHRITPTIAFEGTDMATLRGLIGARLGVGIMPRASTRPPDIVEIAVDDKDLVRPIAVGWMSNRYLPPSAAAFRDTAIASCGLPDQDH
ncbi:LysR family transcriptional regulator [Mycobacterium angelicum]|uniref:LysR family transcriptional regulator n=1 Tax=Mycobacterium angelicum TaxID=470074 RepID=UPI001FE49B6C|nr:LysR family transcriptional regulator [Mycobacterium angelicum]